MRYRTSRSFLLLASWAVGMFWSFAPAAHSEPTEVTIDRSARNRATRPGQQAPAEEKAAFHRSLWTGKFDEASDQSESVAKQLQGGLKFSCREQFGGRKAVGLIPAKAPDAQALRECLEREAAAANYGEQARSIAKQQQAMSMISKASDVASVAAVGGVIYAEMGVKKNNQSETYDSAAKIQKTAGTASYVTGTTDLTLGAWAYVTQKRKLEEMQRNLTGDGASTNNSNLNNGLAAAVEATKNAAYSHMLWGAGKVAAGYGMMKLSERTEKQAESMRSIQEMQDINAILAARAAQAGVLVPTQAPTGGATVPNYITNTPAFAFPSSGSSALAPNPNTGGSPVANGGASIAPGNTRGPAAAFAAKGSGLSGSGGGGASAASGASAPPPGTSAEEDPAKAKAAKEAMGSHFETTLTGGPRAFSGSGSGEAPKEEIPNLAALLGGNNAAPTAATGLSPAQMYNTALEGTEGAEQGSMAGVSGRGAVSLFEITREKLNKMVQLGNLGIPKEVEVK